MAPRPGTLEHLQEMAANYAPITSAQDYATTLAWAVEQLTPFTRPEPMPGWWVTLHEIRDDPGASDEFRQMARKAIDYADKLRRQVPAAPSPEQIEAQERYRREVEQARRHSVDEIVLEYVRVMSTDEFARELAVRATERRDED